LAGLTAPLFAKVTLHHRQLLAYYIGVPAVLALVFAANQTGMARYFPPGTAILYWLGAIFPLWAALDLATRFAERTLRPWNLPAWIVLLMGSIVGMLAFGPYLIWYRGLFAGDLPTGATYNIDASLWQALKEPDRLFGYLGLPVFWAAFNAASTRLFSYPDYLVAGLPPAVPVPAAELPATTASASANDTDSAQASQESPAFLTQLPAKIGRDVVALQAEDHYVRVFTAEGDTLLRYRFSDAVQEARGLGGIQVHRSFWARTAAVKAVSADGKNFKLTLKTGLSIPVSRSYVGALKAAGLLR